MFFIFHSFILISASSLSLSSSHQRNFSQALTSLKLPSPLSPSHLKLTISQAQALRPMPSQPKLDPSPSQLPIASVLACRLVLLHKTHAGISVASPDPCQHQNYLTRPTSASVLLHQTHAADQSACSPIGWVPSDFLFCLVWVEEKNWRFGFYFILFYFFLPAVYCC